jgi:N-acyl-D-aspartate/D-glutamate deacylase
MYDLVIKGATLIDGSGDPARPADIAVQNGRIVAVGPVEGESRETLDATGKMVCPGFIDPHTHYDAQLLWDPNASPSNLHGVTTVMAGNCGFALAPLRSEDADYTRRMMSVVEGMPLQALEEGINWDWNSYSEYMQRLRGNVAVNVGFLAGHSAIRRAVMGEDACNRESNEEELEAMKALLRECIESGAMGFSTSRSFSHVDGQGGPVPSRFASEAEVLALCEEIKGHEGTALEFITKGCLLGLSDEETQLMARMSLAADRPLNWNVFTIDSKEKELYRTQIAALDKAAEMGARVMALTMPVLVGITISFYHRSPIYQLPGWMEVMTLPLDEKMTALRDPNVRRKLEEGAASDEAGVFARLADWGNVRIGDTFSEANRELSGRYVHEIASERGTSDFDTLVDILLEDELRTILWPKFTDNDDESWRMRAEAWDHPYIMLGGSDAGAHLDVMCGANYGTLFLKDCLHGRKLVSVERAVQMLSAEPADLFGLKDRGRIRPGAVADILVFDPQTVGSGTVHLAYDLPGDSCRMYAKSTGVERVYVGGTAIVADGEPTGALPGTVLRAGVDTVTVSLQKTEGKSL